MKTAVYRHFAADGSLLYIGATWAKIMRETQAGRSLVHTETRLDGQLRAQGKNATEAI